METKASHEPEPSESVRVERVTGVAAGDPPGAPRARRTIRRLDWEQCSVASFTV
jgi:hypothetical protein